MKKKYFNDPETPHVSGECGLEHVYVKDFCELKCPVCGQKLVITGIDFAGDEERELVVNDCETCVDDYGYIHVHSYGRTKTTHHNKVYMSCPNKCVEDMKFNVENTTYGNYRELTEIERHGFFR